MPSFVALENEGGTKRGLGDDVRSAAGSQKRDTPPGYMNMNDIHARAVRRSALKTLFCDGFDDPTFAKSALVNDNDADDNGSSAKISNHDIIDQLFLRGYYHDGLSLAMALGENRGSKPGGRGVFHDSLSHLLCSYLVPLALDQEFAPERPTMRQFEAAMDSLKQPFELPVLIFGPRSKRSLALERSEIQTGAMSLLRELTTKYTNAEQPIAAEVAACILNKNRAATSAFSMARRFDAVGNRQVARSSWLVCAASQARYNHRQFPWRPIFFVELVHALWLYVPSWLAPTTRIVKLLRHLVFQKREKSILFRTIRSICFII